MYPIYLTASSRAFHLRIELGRLKNSLKEEKCVERQVETRARRGDHDEWVGGRANLHQGFVADRLKVPPVLVHSNVCQCLVSIH